jgi:hypothetical protein
MKHIAIAFTGVAVVGIAIVAGFVAGARWANAQRLASFYEVGAYEAGDSARYLAAVRAGTMPLTTKFFEDRIDTAFVNLTAEAASGFALSPGARSELKIAADYRRQFPRAKRNADFDERLERGMSLAR